MPSENKATNFRLSPDLVRAIKQEAINEGLSAEMGRTYNPSAVVERILRAYFDAKKPGSEGLK
jgi:hypothetical protein